MTPSVFTSVINGYLPEPHASLLNGIIFGVPLQSTKFFYQQLKEVGLLHIVVLSGMNITMLAAIIASLTGFLPKYFATLFTIFCIVLFVLFVGPAAPIIRAAIMGVLSLLAIIYGRKSTALYSLSLSFILIAIFKRDWISTVSLQLSYGATLGIILFGTTSKQSSSSLSRLLWFELKPSLAAQLFTTPIIFFSFHQISLIAPLSNLLISFTIAPLMFFGLLAAVLGKLHFFLGIVPAIICFVLLSFVVLVIQTLSKIPFAFIQF